MDVETVFVALSAYGKPRLSLVGTAGSRGWYASIELPAPAGCKAEVASDFNHKTPSAAVQQMLDRLNQLRKSNGGEPLKLT